MGSNHIPNCEVLVIERLQILQLSFHEIWYVPITAASHVRDVGSNKMKWGVSAQVFIIDQLDEFMFGLKFEEILKSFNTSPLRSIMEHILPLIIKSLDAIWAV